MSLKTSLTLSFLLCLLVFPFPTPLLAQIDPVGEIALSPSAGAYWGVAEKDGYVYVLTSWGEFAVFDVRSLSVDGPFKTFNTTENRQSLPQTAACCATVILSTCSGTASASLTSPTRPIQSPGST